MNLHEAANGITLPKKSSVNEEELNNFDKTGFSTFSQYKHKFNFSP